MNNYSILKRLADFICELTDFYRELSEELPQLRFTDATAPVNSELKKIAVK